MTYSEQFRNRFEAFAEDVRRICKIEGKVFMKKSLVQKSGLLGILSFLSYAAAVVFAPLAYPGYDWLSQAVSDLSAANAPSLALWNPYR